MARKLETEGSVKVHGLKELSARLKKLDQSTRTKALNNALMEAASPIVDEWSRLAPRSDNPGGSTGKGHAADHISAKTADVASTKKARVEIGPPEWGWYLVFPEFGTRHQPMQAPGRRAAANTMDEVAHAFRDELRKEITKALR